MTTLRLGPDLGTLHVRTGVEGRLARAGHALLLRFDDWEATAEVEGARLVAVRAGVALASLHVERGDGLLPLSPLDRRTIRRNALRALHADAQPHVTYASTSVDGLRVEGVLQVAGAERSTPLDLRVDGDRVLLDVPVRQTAFAVEPYRALAGGLRVQDEVHVLLDVRVPGGVPA